MKKKGSLQASLPKASHLLSLSVTLQGTILLLVDIVKVIAFAVDDNNSWEILNGQAGKCLRAEFWVSENFVLLDGLRDESCGTADSSDLEYGCSGRS